MSLTSKRAALAAAASTVTGVTGYEWPPRAWRPGDAWPTWGGATENDAGGYGTVHVQTWRLLVVLDADPQTAEQRVDTLAGDLVAALAPEMAISGYEPVRLPAEGTSVSYHALSIIGETE